MITAQRKWNGAILVVSATDGPMPQTRELLFLRVRLASYIIVFRTNVYRSELADLVEMENKGTSFQIRIPRRRYPFYRGSALRALKLQ